MPRVFTGAGDLTAATFLAQLLRPRMSPVRWHHGSVVYGVLARTVEPGRSELALVQAQDELVHPSHTFDPVRLR